MARACRHRRRRLPASAAGALALAAFGALPADAAPWYEGIAGVKVLSPSDDVRGVADQVYRTQEAGEFSSSRYAFLLTPGDYGGLTLPVGYYTSVIGVGRTPSDVSIGGVMCKNAHDGHATTNFWRSVEGVTMTARHVVWAVSQAAPMRRVVIDGSLHLSDNNGWSSGGFAADLIVRGLLDMGTQQQWFFRNARLYGGVSCPSGWNYVFVGVEGLDAKRCRAGTPKKVLHTPAPPRIAQKPYLAQDVAGNESSWAIYVPPLLLSTDTLPLAGLEVVAKASAELQQRLDLSRDVFVARPDMNAAQINEGIAGKKGLLVTPGIYYLEAAIKIVTPHFVVLGIGFPTLTPVSSTSALEVADEAADVRVAGLLLEAGEDRAGVGDVPREQQREQAPPPLLLWGNRGRGGVAGGVASDLFARVGAFSYRGCKRSSVESMVEINSDGVTIDNAWLWHADHDDCGRSSDKCYSGHGLVVNGNNVTSYGLSAEHAVGGDIVRWNGEHGETYFYQCELPYHEAAFGAAGYTGYAVSPTVRFHTAKGLGIYIIGGMRVKAALSASPLLSLQNLVTVVIGGRTEQFQNAACVRWGGGLEHCFAQEFCSAMRCVVPKLDTSYLEGPPVPPRPAAPLPAAPPSPPPRPEALRPPPRPVAPLPPQQGGDAVPTEGELVRALRVSILGLVDARNVDRLHGANAFGVSVGVRGRSDAQHEPGGDAAGLRWLLPVVRPEDALELTVSDAGPGGDEPIGQATLSASEVLPHGYSGQLPIAFAGQAGLLRMKAEVLPVQSDIVQDRYQAAPVTQIAPGARVALAAAAAGAALVLCATVAVAAGVRARRQRSAALGAEVSAMAEDLREQE